MKIPEFSALLLIFAFCGAGATEDAEHYFRFTINNKSDLDRLTRVVSIDNVVKDTVYAYANEKEWRAFRALGYEPTELPHPGSLYEHEMSSEPLAVLDWDRYPTYQAYLTMMRQYAQNFPSICKLDTIGLSVQGRQILALKISDSVNVSEDEPEFFYSSTMHGDETVGYVLLLRLADYLLNQYGVPTAEGQRATNLVNNTEIWINPLFNPDGTYRLGGDTTVSNARRGNANGVDLNRNFPDRVSDTNNTTTGRQVETQAMMRWTARHNFTLSANFHGGAQVVNYPWDNGAPSGTYSACPDDAWFINLSRVYSTPNPDMMTGGFTNGITNGCQWYAIFGGRQDWIYWWCGGRETTVELWNTKNPPGSVLPQRWTNNRESFLAYMEQALKGVRGIVSDAETNAPLRARIGVQGIPNVPVFSDSSVGDYHRLLLPGTYTLVAQATGYHPDTVRNVVVVDSVATRVDVALQRRTTSIEQVDVPSTFSLSQNYPNPFNPTTKILYSLPPGVGTLHVTSLRVHDVLGREVATLVNEELKAGDYEVTFDGHGLSSGVYFYRLQSGNITATMKLLLLR